MQDALCVWALIGASFTAPMGNDSFRVREAASQRFAKTANVFGFMYGLPNKDAEAAARLRFGLREARRYLDQLTATILPPTAKMPWIDRINDSTVMTTAIGMCEEFRGDGCGESDWSALSRMYGHYLNMADGPTVPPDWTKYRNATKLMVRKLLERHHPDHVRQLLFLMIEAEAAYIRQYPMVVQPRPTP